MPFGRLVTYPVASSLATLTIASALTGSLYTGMLVTVWQGITHGVLYYCNDLAFDWPRWAAPMQVGPVLAAQLPGKAAAYRSTSPAGRAPLVIDGETVPLPGDGWEVLARTTTPTATAPRSPGCRMAASSASRWCTPRRSRGPASPPPRPCARVLATGSR